MSIDIPSSSIDIDGLEPGFASFLQSLAEAGRTVESAPAAADDQVAAEGYRQLNHLVRSMTEWAAADPAFPYFYRVLDPPMNSKGFDNPDNVHFMARVDPRYEYRVTGRRGTVADLSFQTVAGLHGDGKVARSVGFVDADALASAADGSFAITVSMDEPADGGNWLRMDEATDNVLVRETFGDWAGEWTGPVHIERIDPAGASQPPPPPLTRAEIGRRYAEAGRLVETVFRFWAGYVDGIAAGVPANTVREARLTTGGGVPGQWQCMGRFALEPGQALVVTTHPSSARYQGFQLGSPWFESLEYAHRQTSLNTTQARLDADGWYRFVISAADPGVPNWLDTEGHREGLLLLRWHGLQGEFPTEHQPHARLVDVADVRALLPSDTPTVSPGERVAALAARARACHRRFGR